MPVFFQHRINEHTRLGIWKIEENEEFFRGNVPQHRDVTHPHKRLQHLAGRFLLQFLFPDFPYELIQIADTRKPFLPDERYHFSISHCADFAAAIVSRNQRVGIDIEKPVEKIEKPLEKVKEAPAKTPEPARPAAGAEDSDEVLSSVNGWAKAWAGQKVPAYLGYYAKSFQPPKGESRSSWEASRKDRISRPKSIDVSVDAPKIKFNDDGRAVVSFTQHYRSDSLKTSTGKTLVLAKNNGKWLIVEERVGR